MSLARPLARSLARPLPHSLIKGGGTLLQQLVRAGQPLPSFVHLWDTASFGYYMATPSATVSLDSMSAKIVEFTASGTAGDSSLAVTGTEASGAGFWLGVLQHDDDTYGVYVVSALSGGSCTIFPNLRATTTSKTLRNVGGTVNGQHWTEPAYKALARHVYATTKRSAYRNRYAARWDSVDGVKADWTNVGGLGSGQYSKTTANNVIGGTVHKSGNTFVSRGRTFIRALPTTPFTGKGLSKTFALGGRSGFLEMFVSAADYSGGANTKFYPFRVVVTVDGVDILDQTYSANDGLQRVLVDYTDGDSGTITVTASDETWVSGVGLQIGDTTWWTYDRTETWTDKIIDKNAKTVVIGDSWTTYYPAGGSGVDGVLGTELQAAMTADGGTGVVVSVGEAGTTAEYGLTQFDTLVAPEAPGQVVILYGINDKTSYGVANYARWVNAMYRIGLKCQSIGARPIFMMPAPTSSFSQALDMSVWADELGPGLPI